MRRLIVILLLWTVSIVHAQTDSTNNAWEIVERCIGEPTTPPDDWSYDGVIFLLSNAGVHGLNANIPTPYIIAFDTSDNVFALSGSLSPTGEWFAVPEGRTSRTGAITWGYTVTRIRVHSTDGRRTTYSVPIVTESKLGSQFYTHNIVAPYWLNNQQIVYPTIGNSVQIINPFTNETDLYDGEYIYHDSILFSSRQVDVNDERLLIAQQNFDNIYQNSIKVNPYDDNQFAITLNNSLIIGNKTTRSFTDLCTTTSGIAFSQTGDIVISTNQQIMIIQDNSVYRVAYHSGRIVDWRFPNDD